jgi:HK97 family phage portal protein
MGRNMKQNWFTKLFKRKSYVGGPFWLFNSDGSKILISDSKNDYLNEGFGSNSTVYSIIKQISDKFATLPFILYEVRNKKEFDRYKSLSANLKHNSNLIQLEKLRTKAMDEVENHPFLDAFNALGFEGKAQLCGFYDSTGEAFLWKIKGLSGEEVLQYKLLPSQFMKVNPDATLDGVAGYTWNQGKTLNFTVDEIAHWKKWNPFFDVNGGHLHGLSPLRAGFIDVMTNKAGKNAAHADFSNNGTRGAIVRKEEKPWTPDQRDGINDYIDEKFNGSENRGKIRAININADWMQMGLSASEMETMKALQMTKEDICNVFQFPPRLLSAIEGTFNNVEAAERQLITHCIFPRAVSFRDFVNSQLLTDFKDGHRYFFDVDITALPEMQSDIKKLVDTLKEMPITLNEFREAVKYDSLPDENMNKVYITSSKVPLDQVNMSDDLGSDVSDLEDEGIKDYK